MNAPNHGLLLGQQDAQIHGTYLGVFASLLPAVTAAYMERIDHQFPPEREHVAQQIALQAEAIAVAAMARLGVKIRTAPIEN